MVHILQHLPGLINPRTLRVGQGRLRVGIQRLDQLGQVPGIQDVIRAKHDNIAARSADHTLVEVAGLSEVLSVYLHAEPRVFLVAADNIQRAVSGAVIHNDQLKLNILLGQNRFDGLTDVACIVVRHDNNGNINRFFNAHGIP